MGVSLNRHDKGYKVFGGDSTSTGLAAGSLVLANGLTYAVRHFQRIGKGENNWGHLGLGLLELIPIIGIVTAIFEKILCNVPRIPPKEPKNVGENRKTAIKVLFTPNGDGVDVHYERVFQHKIGSKEWYVKEQGGTREYLLFPFYSLFAPGSPQVRLTPERKVAYKGVKNPRSPQLNEMPSYKGLGHALFLIALMGYSDRQFGNALIDDQNRFVLIDYEFNNFTGSLKTHDLYSTKRLAAFVENGHVNDEDFFSVRNPLTYDEIDESLIDFLLFPFDLLNISGLEEDEAEQFIDTVNMMKRMQRNLISDLYSMDERHLDRLRLQLQDLANSDEPIAKRFSHSLMMRTIDEEAFERAARNRLNTIRV